MSDGVSLIIPTYNRAQVLACTLRSIFHTPISADIPAELIVIDNNCMDETARMVGAVSREAPISVRRVVETRQGLNHCRNRGISEAKYEHLVFLDDDIRLSPTWLDGYFAALKAYDAQCVVGPVFPLFEMPPQPGLTDRVIRAITSGYSRKGEKPLLLPPEVAHELPGCNFAVRKTVANEVGGFAPALDRSGSVLLAGGDFEFGMRLVRAGKRVAYEPRCSIEHIISAEKLSKRYLRRRSYGLGRTRRICENKGGAKTPIRSQARTAIGVLRQFFTAFGHYMAGSHGLAFERELDALQMLGYLREAGLS